MTLLGTKDFTRFIQKNDYSCGPKCAQSILKYYGIKIKYSKIVKHCRTDVVDGTRAGNLCLALIRHGLTARMIPGLTFRGLKALLRKGYVVIAYTDNTHYLAVYGVDEKWIYLSDPWPSLVKGTKIRHSTFLKRFNKWGIAVKKALRK